MNSRLCKYQEIKYIIKPIILSIKFQSNFNQISIIKNLTIALPHFNFATETIAENHETKNYNAMYDSTCVFSANNYIGECG